MSVRTPLAAHALACVVLGGSVPLGVPLVTDRTRQAWLALDFKSRGLANRYNVTFLVFVTM